MYETCEPLELAAWVGEGEELMFISPSLHICRPLTSGFKGGDQF